MEIKELLGWINTEDKRLRGMFDKEDEEKRTYTRAIKLVEEIGELCNEILAKENQQRADKLLYDKNNLSLEFADVLITTLLLAKHMDVNIEESLRSKMEKIDKRYQ